MELRTIRGVKRTVGEAVSADEGISKRQCTSSKVRLIGFRRVSVVKQNGKDEKEEKAGEPPVEAKNGVASGSCSASSSASSVSPAKSCSSEYDEEQPGAPGFKEAGSGVAEVSGLRALASCCSGGRCRGRLW